MNIALPSLVILMLAFPGVLFRYYYRKGMAVSPITLRGVPEEIAWGALFAGCAHAIALYSLTKLNVMPGAGELVVRMVAGEFGKAPNEVMISDTGQSPLSLLTSYVPGMMLYIMIMSALGAIAGALLHYEVERRFLDIRYPLFFKFPNPWSYILSGRCYYLEEADRIFGEKTHTRQELEEIQKDLQFKYVNAIVQQGNAPYVYGGLLEGHDFNADGELDRIILVGAFRYPLPKEECDNDEDYPEHFDVPAHRFIIQYKDIRTLAIRYLNVKELSEVEDTVQPTVDSLTSEKT